MLNRVSPIIQRMLRGYCIILLMCISCYWIFIPGCQSSTLKVEENEINIFNHILIMLLERCHLQIKNIFVYDLTNHLKAFGIAQHLQTPISVSLMNHFSVINDLETKLLTNGGQGVIVSVNDSTDWMPLIRDIYNLRLNTDIKLIIFPELYALCTDIDKVLENTLLFSIPAVYYICLEDPEDPSIYTYTSYGNPNAPFWFIVSQEQLWLKQITILTRPIDNNTTELCEGFNFDRPDKDDITRVAVAIKKSNVENKQAKDRLIPGTFYEEKSFELTSIYQEQADILQKLLNLKFSYYIPPRDGMTIHAASTFTKTLVDLILFTEFLMIPTKFIANSYPIKYDHYAIISYNQGLQTPLEKVGKFYGPCTLISLVVLLIVAFLVIRFKMNKKTHTAISDLLRLLIDSGIDITKKDLSVRIFCLVIFIYFLIIHATFSGHLAEFLTKQKFRKNIDTVEDLKDPRIKKIYNAGYNYGDIEEREILDQKTEMIRAIRACPNLMKEYPESACLGHLASFIQFKSKQNDLNNTYHISTKTLEWSPLAYRYRPGFLLREKFDWAFMFLDETKILYHFLRERQKYQSFMLTRASKIAEVDFRPIKIDDLWFAYLFLIIGNSIGIICFLLELLVFRIGLSWKSRRAKFAKAKPALRVSVLPKIRRSVIRKV